MPADFRLALRKTGKLATVETVDRPKNCENLE
jgi:hypothetical protein